jgi:hypothetical protein
MIGMVILCFGMQSHGVSGSDSINLEYKNEPLEDIFARVSEVSGIAIVVNGQGRKTAVSGRIKNLPVEQAVRQVLKRFNSTVVWDESNGKSAPWATKTSMPPRYFFFSLFFW